MTPIFSHRHEAQDTARIWPASYSVWSNVRPYRCLQHPSSKQTRPILFRLIGNVSCNVSRLFICDDHPLRVHDAP